MLDNLGQMKIFSTLDLKNGYHTIPLDPSSRHYTAFQVEGLEKLQYKVCCMGMQGSSPAFLKLMNNCLDGLLYVNTNSFVDDVIVYSRNTREHLEHLRQVFTRFRKYNLKINAKKAYIGKTKVKFVGFVISMEGVSLDPRKVEKIRNIPRPTNAKSVLSFLGCAKYYRRSVPGFSSLAAPLYAITGNAKFSWQKNARPTLTH